VRKVLRDGADFVKVYAATGSTVEGYPSPLRPQLTVEELRAIVDEAHRAGVKVAGHAIGEASLANVIEAGVDSIEHGMALTPELASQIKKKGIFYCPTLSIFLTNPRLASFINDPETEDTFHVRRHVTADMQLAKEYELEVVSGTDFGGTDEQPHGKNYLEVASIAKYLGNKEALVSATSRAATCSGLANTGQIKKGFDADLVVVNGNPLEDIEAIAPANISAVFKKGRQFAGG
jgi:imidazolonepropionase-like amidohydrolase